MNFNYQSHNTRPPFYSTDNSSAATATQLAATTRRRRTRTTQQPLISRRHQLNPKDTTALNDGGKARRAFSRASHQPQMDHHKEAGSRRLRSGLPLPVKPRIDGSAEDRTTGRPTAAAGHGGESHIQSAKTPYPLLTHIKPLQAKVLQELHRLQDGRHFTKCHDLGRDTQPDEKGQPATFNYIV